MGNPIDEHLRKVKTDTLKTQRDILDVMRNRHIYWMKSDNKVGIEDLHRKIAAAIGEPADLCSLLLASLQQSPTE